MMWVEVEWDELDDDVKALLGVSDLLRTEEQMARDIILGAIDPVIAFGPRFRFEEREPDDFYISIDVPGPCDQVDLAKAWEVARLDAEACRLTLEYDDGLGATLRVYCNNLSWLKFWSVRFPDGEWRRRFELELEARRIGLDGLGRKARARFNLEMMEAFGECLTSGEWVMARKHERQMEQRMAEGRPSYAKDVQAGMARLGGQSTSKLEPDAHRGAASPLGLGSKKMKERGR
jgi:hypothetical protein